jgi:hypothetical protein
MHEHLPALATKIAKMLSIKPEYLVTQPVELRILRKMSEVEVREFATSHGWRVIRRLGGRQTTKSCARCSRDRQGPAEEMS